MKVLVACEFSGIVREVFALKGHDAWSCDILPSEKPGNHIQDDVLSHLRDGWDLMIAHPPCTYLANSGVQYLHKKPERWGQLNEGRKFFMKLWTCSIPKVCIENPTPHKYANLPSYQQVVHPWLFGESVTKRTCLWLRGLPPLMATAWMQNKGESYVGKDGKRNGSVWYQRESLKDGWHNRWRNRSRTFQGIAKAMADQWGSLCVASGETANNTKLHV